MTRRQARPHGYMKVSSFFSTKAGGLQQRAFGLLVSFESSYLLLVLKDSAVKKWYAYAAYAQCKWIASCWISIWPLYKLKWSCSVRSRTWILDYWCHWCHCMRSGGTAKCPDQVKRCQCSCLKNSSCHPKDCLALGTLTLRETPERQ